MHVAIVDIVVLTRDHRPIRAEVHKALTGQRGVAVRIHRVVGTRRQSDATRHVTIARARNHAIACGDSPWVMFVDDDIVIGPDCAARLLAELQQRPTCAALAANVLGDGDTWNLVGHVGMGATLFRREALALIRFRAEPGKCECLVCCQDLRRQGWSIAYLQGLWATHLSKSGQTENSNPPAQTAAVDGHILVAFNRRHFDKFQDQFVRTLRAHGNHEQISVVAYGLYPSEQRILSMLPGVNVRNHAVNGVMPPVRRLLDFQPIVRGLPPQTPVAYWDAGDVIFQSSLKNLWQTVAANPSRLLAVREPKSYPNNAAVVAWSQSIQDPRWRNRIFEMLKTRPFLNSGFAAGTASSMLRYLEEAHRMRHGPELTGSSDWGDQMALNVYCHMHPKIWLEVEAGWNYCVHDQPRGEFIVKPNGHMETRSGTPIYAAHGNARSLRKLSIIR